MLHDSYVHEKLAQQAAQISRRERAVAQALAALPQRPPAARRLARLSGRALIAVGARLLAYGAGRPARLRPSDLPAYNSARLYSQN
jgi:hypothetical protein